MKDIIIYMIDYLPSVITVKLPDGREIGYELYLFSNHSRGFTMCYRWNPAYSDFDVDTEVNCESYDYKLHTCFQETFGEQSNPGAIWGAEYIRSLPELKEAAKSCYNFLRKHNLAPLRTQNIEKKEKLFSVMVSS